MNIFDGTVIAPLSPFTKIWRMRNNGTAVWPQRTQLVWIGGDKLSNEFSVEVQVSDIDLVYITSNALSLYTIVLFSFGMTLVIKEFSMISLV